MTSRTHSCCWWRYEKGGLCGQAQLVVDHDRLFKELLSTFLLSFSTQTPSSFSTKEVFTDVASGATYEADIVVKMRFQQQPAFFIIHLEHQAQLEEAFDLRMFRYFALFHFKTGLPVYPIALFSDASARCIEPDTYRVAFPDLEVLQFRYQLLQLRRLNWRDFATRRHLGKKKAVERVRQKADTKRRSA